jgi:hypothetical protein
LERKTAKKANVFKAIACIIIAAIVAFSAAACASGGTQKAKKPQNNLKKSTLVGFWYVPSENLEDGVEEYYEFTKDNTYRLYELKDGIVDLAELKGSYSFANGTATTKANVQFFEKDSSGNDTISSGHVTGILKCKRWTKNTIHFLEKSEDYDSSEKLTLKRMDTDEKIKEAEQKRLNQIEKIDAQIDAKAGVDVY